VPVRAASVLAVAVAVLVGAGVAKADADPASDVLIKHELYLPYDAKVSPAAESRLRKAIARARSAGRPVRVALIASPKDLGGVPQLFGRPLWYARYLDIEIEYFFRGDVLVVMPQGAGLARAGGRLVADPAVIAARPGDDPDDLADTAAELVDEIATGKPARLLPDTPMTIPSRQSGAPNPAHDPVSAPDGGFPTEVMAGVVCLAVLVLSPLAVIFARRRRA